jgi:CMP-N,N'-diacetyllegionaminic acid synthase
MPRDEHQNYVILGVTPARGGSKGVPRKNLRLVGGRPLIAWTIEAALAARQLDRYVVSTEDDEIAVVARRCGAEVLMRPAALATDDVDTLTVLQHVLTDVTADTLVLLQATSPVRDLDLVDRCIVRFLREGADSLATGFVCTQTEYGKNALRRQDIEGFFCDDGNVYVMRADLVRAGDRYGARIERVVLDRDQNIDIDDEFDLWLAERVLEKRGCREM